LTITFDLTFSITFNRVLSNNDIESANRLEALLDCVHAKISHLEGGLNGLNHFAV